MKDAEVTSRLFHSSRLLIRALGRSGLSFFGVSGGGTPITAGRGPAKGPSGDRMKGKNDRVSLQVEKGLFEFKKGG